MNTTYIYEYCEAHLTEKRKRHSEGVRLQAEALAERYGADAEKARIAAVCHDLYRGQPIELIDEKIREYGLPERYLGNASLAHGKIAVEVMKRELGIDDPEILNAVSYHTTGRAGMSLLEKIIFIADATERDRDYPGVEEIRETSFRDLDLACMMSLKGTIDHLIEQGNTVLTIDKDTIEAYDYLKKERLMDSREQALFAAKLLNSKKAADVTVIDIAEKSAFADYLVICSGGSNRQIEALSDDIEDAFAKEGILPKGVEGRNGSGWVLIDLGDVIVNVFSKDTRDKYNIEKVWGDCTFIDVEE